MKASTEKKPCALCGVVVARLNAVGAPTGKRCVPHKCPHGVWCDRGGPLTYGNNNSNCRECRDAQRQGGLT